MAISWTLLFTPPGHSSCLDFTGCESVTLSLPLAVHPTAPSLKHRRKFDFSALPTPAHLRTSTYSDHLGPFRPLLVCLITIPAVSSPPQLAMPIYSPLACMPPPSLNPVLKEEAVTVPLLGRAARPPTPPTPTLLAPLSTNSPFFAFVWRNSNHGTTIALYPVDALGASSSRPCRYDACGSGCKRSLRMLSMSNSGTARVSAWDCEELQQHSVQRFRLRACVRMEASGYPVVCWSKRQSVIHADCDRSFWTGILLHKRLQSLLGEWQRLSGGECNRGRAPCGSEGRSLCCCFSGSGTLPRLHYSVAQMG